MYYKHRLEIEKSCLHQLTMAVNGLTVSSNCSVNESQMDNVDALITNLKIFATIAYKSASNETWSKRVYKTMQLMFLFYLSFTHSLPLFLTNLHVFKYTHSIWLHIYALELFQLLFYVASKKQGATQSDTVIIVVRWWRKLIFNVFFFAFLFICVNWWHIFVTSLCTNFI